MIFWGGVQRSLIDNVSEKAIILVGIYNQQLQGTKNPEWSAWLTG